MKAEHFHPNPQIRRLRDTMRTSDGEEQQGAEHEGEAAAPGKVEVHHPDHPENPTPGQFHTVTHRDGKKESHSHADLEAVKEHMQNHFGDELQEAQGEGECPECGAPIKEGRCEQCGYDGAESSESSEK